MNFRIEYTHFNVCRIFSSSAFIFLLLVFAKAGAQCVTADLNISTGYNQTTGTTVTPGSTTVEPAWTSRVSPAAASAILAMPDIIGCYDAVPCPSWPAPITGTTWAMGQNDWGYMTTGTGGLGFTDTFSRPFMVCGTDSINFVINNIITDDGITEIILDGAVLVYYSSPSSGISYYPGAIYHLGMLSGNHSVGVVIYNLNNGVYKNAIGLDMSAHLVSASGTASLSTTGYCPVYTTSARDTAVCSASTVTLYADTAGSYQWNTGDTLSSITVTSGGTYWVLISKGNCRYEIDTTHLSYGATLAVDLGNDTTICAGSSITLATPAPAGSTFNWSTGATTPTITVSSAGTYWVKVNLGSCSGTDTINVVVNPLPVVDLGPDQSVCIGTPITLQPTGSYVSPTYLWSTGSTAVSISPSTSGNYWLQVTVDGCSGTDTVNVDFRPNPGVTIGHDTDICPGRTLTLGSPEPAGVQYTWSTGSTDSSITVSEPGTYTLTVALNGCKTSASINVFVGATDSITLGPDTTLCQGESLRLEVNNNTAIWSNGHTGSSISVSFPGIYWVTIPEQCGIASDTVKVDFHICDIGFPSAFTPNDDGLNDVIGVEGTLKYYSNFSLSIYNRWGQRVFYTEDIYSGWDGVFNGTKQDLGTYFYMIFYTFEGKKHMMKGDFQLIR